MCKRARWSTGEAMEVRGGNGYVEDWINPRLLRDAHLGSIWEGPSNVIALDVLRAFERDAADETLFADIDERLAALHEPLVRRAGCLVQATARRLRATVERVKAADAPEREAAMMHLTERLTRLWAASLLLEEADLTPRPPSLRGKGEQGLDTVLAAKLPSPRRRGVGGEVGYRKLAVAAEYLRRRLLVPEGEVWLGPRPAATNWFDAVVDCRPVPAEAAVSLIGALEDV